MFQQVFLKKENQHTSFTWLNSLDDATILMVGLLHLQDIHISAYDLLKIRILFTNICVTPNFL